MIETVERVKAALPRLQASIPPSVRVNTIADRTQNIRASVADVQFTLVLTIALVVMIIFVFLRNLPATLIPSVTVPLALMGTAAGMYLLGYSRDNLSLMAITIAVGFVVDDAIVVLENIYRHVEEGMAPMEAAIKGAAEIGFTVVSISVSLVAVFIPLLLMGGIVGRLFREFAVTVTMTIPVSVVVSLTLTPMLCSRYLRHTPSERHGRLYQLFERGFDAMLAAYRRGLDVVMRHQFLTLCTFIGTVALSATLFVIIPKRLLPAAGHGLPVRLRRVRPGCVVQVDERAHDPARRHRARRPRRGGGRHAGRPGDRQHRPRLHQPEAQEEGRTATADEIIARLRPSCPAWKAPTCSCRPAMTSTWAAGCRARSTSTR